MTPEERARQEKAREETTSEKVARNDETPAITPVTPVPSAIPPETVPSVPPAPPALAAAGAEGAEGAAGAAERYLARELGRARRDLRLAQIGGSLLTLFVLGYLGWITGTLTRSLEPAAASEIARGVIAERVEVHANDLSEQLKERVPAMIAALPDHALREMPRFREQLEVQAESDMRRYFAEAATQLDGHMDDFLGAHKDQIKEVLAGGQEPETVRELGAALQGEFLGYVKRTSVGGESLQSKLDQSLEALTKVRKRMARLAANEGLTPQEKKARRAIALLSQTIEEKRAQEPGIGMGAGA